MRFDADACPVQALTETAERGCSIDKCLAIEKETVLEALGGLPRDKESCAAMALVAIWRTASKQYKEAKLNSNS